MLLHRCWDASAGPLLYTGIIRAPSTCMREVLALGRCQGIPKLQQLVVSCPSNQYFDVLGWTRSVCFIRLYDQSSDKCHTVFNTYPQPFLTKTGQVFSEIVASAVLVFVIFAMKDDNNLGAGDKVPLMLFFLIFGIGATLGWETGYAINLARDFGPRLFTYCVGYGTNVWKAGGKFSSAVF